MRNAVVFTDSQSNIFKQPEESPPAGCEKECRFSVLRHCLKIVTQSQNQCSLIQSCTKCPCLMLLPDSGEVNRVEPQSSWLWWLADYPQVTTAHTRLTQEVIGLTGVRNKADEWVMMYSNMLEHKHRLISAGDKWPAAFMGFSTLLSGTRSTDVWHMIGLSCYFSPASPFLPESEAESLS